MEYKELADRLNFAWTEFHRTSKPGGFVRVMNEASRVWREICAAGCEEAFIKSLTFIDWDEKAKKPQDKWARLRTWAAYPVVLKYADQQPKRGWSVWREIPKAVRALGLKDVERRFASGEWGPGLRRETVDKLVGNRPRHPKKTGTSASPNVPSMALRDRAESDPPISI